MGRGVYRWGTPWRHEVATQLVAGGYPGPGRGFPGGGYPAGRGGFPGGGGGGGSPFFAPQLISVFTNVLLQMPFSRRAEAEADLIGMKLMALAGYDPANAPETFRRLEVCK